MIIYRFVQSKQPEVLEELKRRRLLRWEPGVGAEEAVDVDGKAYRDVTAEVAAAGEAHDSRMDHASYRRRRGVLRQVKHVEG